MTRLQHILFNLSFLSFSFVALLLGWLVAHRLLVSSAPKVEKDPLLLRPYAFDMDIAKGGINPLAISSGRQVVLWSAKQVIQQKLTGLSRQKNWLQLKRIVQTSEQVSRDRLLELLTELELTSSLERKRELQAQIAALTSSPHEYVRYGVFLDRRQRGVENQSLK